MSSLTIEFLNRLKLTSEQGSTLAKIGEYKGRQELSQRLLAPCLLQFHTGNAVFKDGQ